MVRLSLVTITTVLCLSLFANSQDKLRRVDQGMRYDNAPLTVLSCAVGKVTFSECKNVHGGSDWWRQLTFSVKNSSKKTISELIVNIRVEKQGKMPSGLGMNVLPNVPIRMIADERGWPSGRYGIRIAPGEVFDISVSEAEIKSWKRQLDQYDVADLGDLKLDVRGVYFDDGSNWFYGVERRLKAGQSADPTKKLIEAQFQEKNEPVKIIGLRADGLQLELGVPFRSGDDWLRDLTIVFLNVSGRTILSVEFDLTFLASFPTGPNLADSLVYGLSPNHRQWDMSKMRVLKPGEIAEVNMDAIHYKRLKAFLNHQEDVSTRTTTEVRISFASFADGTRWQYGVYFKPNSEKPGEFVREK